MKEWEAKIKEERKNKTNYLLRTHKGNFVCIKKDGCFYIKNENRTLISEYIEAIRL